MFVGWAKSRHKRKKRAGKGPSHRSQLTTKDNHVKFAIIDGLVLVWDAGMEATSRMQGESQEHLARLPVGCHRLLKWDFIVLVFLGTELQEAKCDSICFTRGCPLTYASHFLNTRALWNKDEMAPKSGGRQELGVRFPGETLAFLHIEKRRRLPHEWTSCSCAHLAGTWSCWLGCHTHLGALFAECVVDHRSTQE